MKPWILAKRGLRRFFKPRSAPLGLISLAVAAVALLAVRVIGDDGSDGAGWVILRSVSDSFTVALVLAVSVESYFKRQAFREVASGAFWALLNRDEVPAEHRVAIQEAAGDRMFYRRVSWGAHFDWVDEDRQVVAVTLSVNTQAISYEPDGFRPNGRRYLIASVGDRVSEHLSFRLEAEWVGEPLFDPVVVAANADEPYTADIARYVTVEEDRVLLDEDMIRQELVGDAHVRPGTRFLISRKVRYYRAARDFVPVVQNKAQLSTEFRASGPALPDLAVSVIDLRRGGKATALADMPSKHDYGGVGTTYIISWRPRTAETVPENAETRAPT